MWLRRVSTKQRTAQSSSIAPRRPWALSDSAAPADLAVNVAGSFIVYLADVVPAASESDETV